jgi:hypothetical protein
MSRMPLVSTEAARLKRGGHVVRHASSHIVLGETEEGSHWVVRAITWEPGEEPMLYLVGKRNQSAWVPFTDVEIGVHA